MDVNDRACNRRRREREPSPPDRRMRPASGDGRDNMTRPERGPLGTGGAAAPDLPRAVAVLLSGRGFAERRRQRGTRTGNGRVGLNPDFSNPQRFGRFGRALRFVWSETIAATAEFAVGIGVRSSSDGFKSAP